MHSRFQTLFMWIPARYVPLVRVSQKQPLMLTCAALWPCMHTHTNDAAPSKILSAIKQVLFHYIQTNNIPLLCCYSLDFAFNCKFFLKKKKKRKGFQKFIGEDCTIGMD